MVHGYEHQVLELDIVWPVSYSPMVIGVVFHGSAFPFLDETLNTLGDILREFGKGYWSWWVSKILCRDLSTPLSITWPLKGYKAAVAER